MSTNHHSMNQLEQEITSDSITAVEDEQLNANSIYSSLEGEKASLYYKIPFPEVQEYDTGIDYDDISDIQYKKGKNKEIWKKIKALDVYCSDGNLFCGHLNVGNTNFYFIEGEKKSRNLQNSESDLLINVDDRDYNNIKR